MDNYESILDQISAVESAVAGGTRDIWWLTHTQAIGVARDQFGRLEIFLPGRELKPQTATVRSALQHHDWHREGGEVLSANRLLFPAPGHFNQIGAFICTELLRNGAGHDIEGAFNSTEPIIELAIKRLQISESSMLGLAGELLFLNALVQQTNESQVGSILDCWAGWHHSLRDFTWNGVGVEVKTTLHATSSHRIQGVHQVEAAPATEDDAGEDRLVLVSIGLTPSEPNSNSFSVPMLVDRILQRLEAVNATMLKDSFLSHLAEYGSETGFGYRHATMAEDAPFTESYTVTFCRGYDMGDPLIGVLRQDDLVAHNHIDHGSVRFTVRLPAVVSGQNPISGVNQVARSILG